MEGQNFRIKGRDFRIEWLNFRIEWLDFGKAGNAECVPSCPQHVALLLKYVIQVAIPDIPAWVAEEMAKLEYQRREAFKVGPVSPECPHGVPKGCWGPQSVLKMSPGSVGFPRCPQSVPGAGGLPEVSPWLVSPRCAPGVSPCLVSPQSVPMPGAP